MSSSFIHTHTHTHTHHDPVGHSQSMRRVGNFKRLESWFMWSREKLCALVIHLYAHALQGLPGGKGERGEKVGYS